MPLHLHRSVPPPHPGSPYLIFSIGSREACEELMFLEDQLQKWLRSELQSTACTSYRIQTFNWFAFFLCYLVVMNKCLQMKLIVSKFDFSTKRSRNATSRVLIWKSTKSFFTSAPSTKRFFLLDRGRFLYLTVCLWTNSDRFYKGAYVGLEVPKDDICRISGRIYDGDPIGASDIASFSRDTHRFFLGPLGIHIGNWIRTFNTHLLVRVIVCGNEDKIFSE